MTIDPNLVVTMKEATGSYGPKVVATSHSLFVDMDQDIIFDESVEGRYVLVRLDEASWYCEIIGKWLIDGSNCAHEDCNGEPSGVGDNGPRCPEALEGARCCLVVGHAGMHEGEKYREGVGEETP